MDAYGHYEAALVALGSAPERLAHDEARAQRDCDDSTAAIEAEFHQRSRRLVGLRRTAETRYEASVSVLARHGVRLEPRVRPDITVPGDEQELHGALREQAAAVANVVAEDRDARRTIAARHTAEALRVRQQKLQRAAELSRRAALIRRQRRWVALGGGIAALLITVAVVLASLNQ